MSGVHDDGNAGETVPMPHIAIRGLSHEYGTDDARVTALTDIDLDIDEGEFVSIIGPSGCGKTTLLRIVGGLLTPTKGTVRIDGAFPDEARTAASLRSGIPGLGPSPMAHRSPKRESLNRVAWSCRQATTRTVIVDELLEIVRLDGFGKTPTRTSSPAA